MPGRPCLARRRLLPDPKKGKRLPGMPGHRKGTEKDPSPKNPYRDPERSKYRKPIHKYSILKGIGVIL